MAIKRKKGSSYGDAQADIREELVRYSQLNGYLAVQFADAICACGQRQWTINVDENAGVAIATCATCKNQRALGDSEDYLEEAEPEQSECRCGQEELEVTIGLALYANSDDVRWLYLGCRCPECGLLGCYGDWKNEFIGYHALLKKV